MRLIFLLAIWLFFSGCNLFQTQAEKAQKIQQEKIAFEKKVRETKEIQLAMLESKKELAKIQKDIEIEKIRSNSKLDKQKILLEQEKSKVLFDQELKRYMMLIFGLVVLVGLFLIYYYFKKRHDDKLTAYNDNLKKYFYHKENEARVKIAQELLKTISSGKLDKNQENQLISAFKGEAEIYNKNQIENQNQEIDVEIKTKS